MLKTFTSHLLQFVVNDDDAVPLPIYFFSFFFFFDLWYSRNSESLHLSLQISVQNSCSLACRSPIFFIPKCKEYYNFRDSMIYRFQCFPRWFADASSIFHAKLLLCLAIYNVVPQKWVLDGRIIVNSQTLFKQFYLPFYICLCQHWKYSVCKIAWATM